MRPSLSTSGAPSAVQMALVSMVADIITIFSSGLSVCCTSRVSASARSELMLRS